MFGKKSFFLGLLLVFLSVATSPSQVTTFPAASTINGVPCHVGSTCTVPLTVSNANCVTSANPAPCDAGRAGMVAIPSNIETLTITTTAITSINQIFLTSDQSLSTILGVTCSSHVDSPHVESRVPGVSFAVHVSAIPGANPVCLNFMIIN